MRVRVTISHDDRPLTDFASMHAHDCLWICISSCRVGQISSIGADLDCRPLEEREVQPLRAILNPRRNRLLEMALRETHPQPQNVNIECCIDSRSGDSRDQTESHPATVFVFADVVVGHLLDDPAPAADSESTSRTNQTFEIAVLTEMFDHVDIACCSRCSAHVCWCAKSTCILLSAARKRSSCLSLRGYWNSDMN